MLRSNDRMRRGFTIVELLIATAATVLIMAILSTCFSAGTNAMREVRAQGDMSEHLRAFSNTLRRDLQSDHFLPAEGANGVNYYGRRVSNYDFSAATPTSGFFYLVSPPGTYEGNDQSFDVYRNTGCSVWFTSVLPGGSDENLYSTRIPNGPLLTSEAAEIAYFLAPENPPRTTTGSPTMQVFNLHRRQRLIAKDLVQQQQFSSFLPGFNAVISPDAGNGNSANTMARIAQGGRSGTIFAPLGNGDDIVLSNVLSFEIKPTWQHMTNLFRNPVPFGGQAAGGGSPAYGPNHDAPFDNLSTASGGNAAQVVFDSTGMAGLTMPVRINALQIRVRIYDMKVKTARQITMIIEQ